MLTRREFLEARAMVGAGAATGLARPALTQKKFGLAWTIHVG